MKWNPSSERKDDLLVACMHDGCKVLRFDLSGGGDETHQLNSHEVVKRFDKHESMAYGADWSYKTGNKDMGSTVVASCSFYDHLLQIWRA